jgi:hypothetical protein
MAKGLYTSQIESALLGDPVSSEYFDGVFASDKLPGRIESLPSSLVANTDPASKPGTHWIAFHFDAQGRLDVFDSFGLPPSTYPRLDKFSTRNASVVEYNDLPLQGYNSNACGYYCIAFLALRARGFSMAEIQNKYWTGESGARDETVIREVSGVFDIGKKRNSRLGCNQCSRSLAECCKRK